MQDLHSTTVTLYSAATVNSDVTSTNGVLTPVEYPNVTIETILGCNAKCAFCGYHNITRKRGVMSLDVFHKVIDEVASWNYRVEIVPTMWGEFFLNPHYKHILDYIDTHLPQCTTAIPTNASLVDDDKIDAMVGHKNLTYLGVSLYTIDPEKYTILMGLPSSTINKAAHLISRISTERPDVTINVGTTDDTRFVSAEELASLARVSKRWITPHEITQNRAVGGFHQNPPHTSQCLGMFTRLFVLKDGNVCICCFDPNCELYVGDVTKNTILEIWNGGLVRRYQQMHNTGIRSSIELCASCNHSL